MVSFIKWLLIGIAGLVVLIFAAVLVFATPDTDRVAMIEKYGGQEARFASAPSGLQVHYRVSGPQDAPVLLLIHGLNASLHTWEAITPDLARDHRVVALDLPGHGLTGPHPAGDYSFEASSAAISAVLAREGIAAAVLVGSSYGGWAAWRHALAHPQEVSELVLVSSAGMSAGQVQPEGEETLAFRLMSSDAATWVVERVTPRWLVESALRQSVSVEEIADDAMVDRYWELIRYPGNRAAALDVMRTDRQPEMAARLGEIAVPVLLLWGAQDAVVPPRAAEAYRARLPQAELVMLDGVGHIPMEEAPRRTIGAIRDFLQVPR